MGAEAVIANDGQYRTTKRWARQFAADAVDLAALAGPSRSRLQQAKIDAVLTTAAELREELAAYEAPPPPSRIGGG